MLYVTNKHTMFTAVGMRYLNKECAFKQATSFWLKAENDNAYDPQAVQIMVNQTPVAYVAKKDCGKIRKLMLKGYVTANCVRRYANSAVLVLED